MKVFVGIDVGSVSIKLAACGTVASPLNPIDFPEIVHSEKKSDKPASFYFNQDISFLLSHDVPTRGEPAVVVRDLLDDFRRSFDGLDIIGICMTGNGSNAFGSLFNASVENSFKAIARGCGMFFTEARTILELGGETARYIRIDRQDNGTIRIVDYERNGDCAAGTGAFIEQQAARLKYSLEEIGDAVLQVEKGALIAGRCSVFAKTDMIHAQQKGYTPPAILHGLCDAVVRNFKSAVCKGKEIKPKIVFAGGLARNKGIVASMKRIFELDDNDLMISPFPTSLGAIGCALIERQRQSDVTGKKDRGIHKSARTFFPSTPVSEKINLPPLSTENVLFLHDRVVPYSLEGKNFPIDVHLGIDVGSVSTNLVLLDDHDNLIKEIYVRTEGRPIEVVNKGLRDIETEFGSRIRIQSVGTTGSGRELIGTLVGAHTINDEITAHKTGALFVSEQLQEEEVDTIFEIGGQDSKYISIDDGVVVDFTMNEACAAGTGSFLEEQAERLGISIVKEFSALAFQSKSPIQFGERCTVFIESDINTRIHDRAAKEDIVAGLAYSIALNYLNRVVRGRKIGNVIYFQGGTAYNHAVAAAFAMILKKRIIVPPHNGVIGAIGMAILAREKIKSRECETVACEVESTRQEFRLDLTGYSTRQFTCKACSNYCEIQQVKIGKEKAHWGDKCSDKFRQNTKVGRKAVIPDLFSFREKLLLENYSIENRALTPKIGIPRALTFYNRFPFFHTYFSKLGFQVILSDPSHRAVVDSGVEATTGEPCFPVTLANGHLQNLLGKKVDYILTPNIVDYEGEDSDHILYACPWTTTHPFVARSQPVFESAREKFLIPTIHFSRNVEDVKEELAIVAHSLRITVAESNCAADEAFEAQRRFDTALHEKGAEVLDAVLNGNHDCIVLVGRPYNVYDPTVNLNLAGKLRDFYGINVIPYDFLNLGDHKIGDVNENMYWYCGKHILQAALAVRYMENAHIIYVTNFKCGPDSYVKHFVAEASGKPFLTLQFDGHNNDAGMITRCEAYLHSKGLIA